jgi:hypothetical protein
VTTVSAQVEVRVEIRPGLDPVALERQVAEEGRRVAKALFLQVVSTVDASEVAQPGRVRQRREARWIATLFGRVRIRRYRVKDGPRTFHPVDHVLGLRQGEPSQGIRRLVADLARKFSYRDTARVVSLVTGDPFTYQQVSRLSSDDADGDRAVGRMDL